MRVLSPVLAVSSSFVLLAAACSKKGGAGESPSARAIAALLPPDTVVYARVTSLDAFAATARTVVTAFGGDAASADRDELLAGLGGMAGDTTQIDPGRAIGVALVAAKGTRPAPLVFVPVRDGAKYAASLRANGIEAVVAGDYAVLPFGGKYEKPSTPSPLADAMPAGLLAVRVDVAKTSANLGVVIHSGLDLFEREMAAAGNTGGIDGEAVAEAYSELAKALLAAGTTLDLVVDETAGRATLTGTYTARPGSELDGWSSAPVDLSTFAGKLNGGSAVEVVAVADWAALWPRIEPIMATLIDFYPASMRPAVQGLMQAYPAVYARLGPVMVGGLDFADGMRMDMHIAPPDAKALLAEVDALGKRPELADFGVTVTAGAAKDEGGTAVREYLLTFDPSRLAGASVDDAQAQAMRQQLTTVFQALFGSDGVPMRLAVRDGRGVVGIGKAGGDPAAVLAPAGGSWPETLRQAMASVSGCNPLFVERFDFAALFRGIAPLLPEAERRTLPLPPAGTKADFVMGGGVRGAEWRMFVSVDLAGLGATVQATQPR